MHVQACPSDNSYSLSSLPARPSIPFYLSMTPTRRERPRDSRASSAWRCCPLAGLPVFLGLGFRV
jgi:hypothetical protein